METEVGLRFSGLWWPRLGEVLALAEMVVVQLVLERIVVGLGEHALLLKDGQDTHGLEYKRSNFNFKIVILRYGLMTTVFCKGRHNKGDLFIENYCRFA